MKKIKITLEVGGIYREYVLEEDEIVNLDLNAQLEDMLDTVNKVEGDEEEEDYPFSG